MLIPTNYLLLLKDAFLISCCFLCLSACGTQDHPATSISNTTIQPCPPSPNCVSSLSDTASDSFVEPFTLTMDIEQAKEHLIKVILKMPKTKLINQTDDYLHFTFTSSVFKFVDDVQLVFKEDGEQTTINIRSASRTGHSDFGVNRQRVEQIRKSV